MTGTLQAASPPGGHFSETLTQKRGSRLEKASTASIQQTTSQSFPVQPPCIDGTSRTLSCLSKQQAKTVSTLGSFSTRYHAHWGCFVGVTPIWPTFSADKRGQPGLAIRENDSHRTRHRSVPTLLVACNAWRSLRCSSSDVLLPLFTHIGGIQSTYAGSWCLSCNYDPSLRFSNIRQSRQFHQSYIHIIQHAKTQT